MVSKDVESTFAILEVIKLNLETSFTSKLTSGVKVLKNSYVYVFNLFRNLSKMSKWPKSEKYSRITPLLLLKFRKVLQKAYTERTRDKRKFEDFLKFNNH